MSEKSYQRAYLIIVLAVLTEAITFIMRVGSALQIETLYFRENYLATATEMTATVLAAPFLGFALSLLFVSPFIDWFGMRRVLVGAAVAFIVGTVLTILTPENSPLAWNYLRFGAFLTGLGWGAVESVINPLVIAIYPQDKVRRLNGAHAWWSAGIILGGLLCVLMDYNQMSFQAKTSMGLIPALLFGLLALKTSFPVTERVSSGISNQDMFLEILRKPVFLLWLLLMLIGSLTEFGASSFVDIALTQLVGLQGVWLLIYVAAVMFIMRRNAGLLSSRLAPAGVLCVSMLLASVGLLGLSISEGPVIALLSATLWGTGASLIWPTMMANISYRFPKGGTFFLGLIGLAACMGEWLFIPQLGALYDWAKIHTAGSIEGLQNLQPNSPMMQEVLISGAGIVFQVLATLAAGLVVVYGLIWAREKVLSNQD